MRASRRLLALAATAAVVLSITACAGSSEGDPAASAEEKKTITIGFVPGPYEDMFVAGIEPILEQEGYTVERAAFTDGVIVNVALGSGEIDANIMQHEVYMDSINLQEGLHNASLVQVPTPPMALFGGKATSLDDVESGSTVAVPNQPSNMYRALKVLEQVGWITLKDTIDPATASLGDVDENEHGIEFVAIENAQQVASLGDVDYSVIQGNFVVSGGLDLTDALALEDLVDEFSVIVSVDEKSLDTSWAKALKAAYESPEFADFVASETQYDGYRLPAALSK